MPACARGTLPATPPSTPRVMMSETSVCARWQGKRAARHPLHPRLGLARKRRRAGCCARGAHGAAGGGGGQAPSEPPVMADVDLASPRCNTKAMPARIPGRPNLVCVSCAPVDGCMQSCGVLREGAAIAAARLLPESASPHVLVLHCDGDCRAAPCGCLHAARDMRHAAIDTRSTRRCGAWRGAARAAGVQKLW